MKNYILYKNPYKAFTEIQWNASFSYCIQQFFGLEEEKNKVSYMEDNSNPNYELPYLSNLQSMFYLLGIISLFKCDEIIHPGSFLISFKYKIKKLYS
jgi:hypothetical protein